MLQGVEQQKQLLQLQAIIQQLETSAEPLLAEVDKESSSVALQEVQASLGPPTSSQVVELVHGNDHSYWEVEQPIREEELPPPAVAEVKSTMSRLAQLLQRPSPAQPVLQPRATVAPPQQSAAATPHPQVLFINQSALNKQFCLTGTQVTKTLHL